MPCLGREQGLRPISFPPKVGEGGGYARKHRDDDGGCFPNRQPKEKRPRHGPCERRRGHPRLRGPT